MLGGLCWVRIYSGRESGRLKGARIEEGWGEQGARRRGEGRGWSYLSRAGQDAIVCRRLPARPDGDGWPCCDATILHSLAQVPARAGCAYGAQREGYSCHATTMLAGSLWATVQPCTRTGGPAVSLASQGCPH